MAATSSSTPCWTAARGGYSEILPDERGDTCAQFLLDAARWFAEQGVRIERVVTDEAMNYTRSAMFKEAVAAMGGQHRTTGPYNPKANGKVEALSLNPHPRLGLQAALHDQRCSTSRFSSWLAYYNHRRPYSALKGLAPMVVLVNKVRGNHS